MAAAFRSIKGLSRAGGILEPFESRVRESFGRQAFMTTLGAEIKCTGPGSVEIVQESVRLSVTYVRELVRGLGLWSATAAVVGVVIGQAVFLVGSEVARDTRSATLSIAAWIVGGLLALWGSLCLAELGAAMPRAGGYAYLTLIVSHRDVLNPPLTRLSQSFLITASANN